MHLLQTRDSFWPTLSARLHPKRQSGAQVSRDLLFCFHTKVPHAFFRPAAVCTRSHAVSGLLDALATPGWIMEWTETKWITNHIATSSTLVYARRPCAHAGRSCVDSHPNADSWAGLFLSYKRKVSFCLCCRSLGRRLPPEETSANGQERTFRWELRSSILWVGGVSAFYPAALPQMFGKMSLLLFFFIQMCNLAKGLLCWD